MAPLPAEWVPARTRRCAERALWAHSCHEALTRQIDFGQAQHDERARGVLGQAAVVHLGEAP